MAKKATAARKRPSSKTSGKLKSTILARIRKEAGRGRGRGRGPRDYYAKDPATKPGGGYLKGDFIKSDERGGRKTTRKTTRKSTRTKKTKRAAKKR